MPDIIMNNSQTGIVGDNAHMEGGVHFHGPPAREVGIPFMANVPPSDSVPRAVEFNALRETGLVGATLPDEVVGPASGFLQAGAAGVVSTLRAVNDQSTALLAERFCRH